MFGSFAWKIINRLSEYMLINFLPMDQLIIFSSDSVVDDIFTFKFSVYLLATKFDLTAQFYE